MLARFLFLPSSDSRWNGAETSGWELLRRAHVGTNRVTKVWNFGSSGTSFKAFSRSNDVQKKSTTIKCATLATLAALAVSRVTVVSQTSEAEPKGEFDPPDCLQDQTSLGRVKGHRGSGTRRCVVLLGSPGSGRST